MNVRNAITTIPKSDFRGTALEPLLQLTDCPTEMQCIGTLPKKSDYKFITVVGSRSCSQYAQQALEHIISRLSGQKVCVISGLALGIDGLAHRLAIEHSLPTISLPGSGLDSSVLYPASHKKLTQDIIDSGGALLSEFPDTQYAARWTFPKRNRLMARMADLVLVIEAGEKSGTLITARNTLEYNVNLGIVPNTIFAESARGSNHLIKEGAHPICSADDVLDLLGMQSSKIPEREYADVTDDERLILNALKNPCNREELSQLCDMDAHVLSQNLSLLEIKGYVSESLGMMQRI